MRPLCQINESSTCPKVLTSKRDVPFILSFHQKLQAGYTFKEFGIKECRSFQNFLDKISNMSVQQVDSLYARDTDKNDVVGGEKVYHYEVTDAFRIHVIYENGCYCVIRLDPFHKFHNGKKKR